MTDEGQGHDPDQAPAPPASTRWSEDPVQDDDALPPPFVPGRPATEAVATPDPGSPDEKADPTKADPTEEPALAEEPEALQASLEEVDTDDDFPFDQFDIEGTADGGREREEAIAEAEPAESSMGWSPAELIPDDEVSEPSSGQEPQPEPVVTPEPEPVGTHAPELELEPVGAAGSEEEAPDTRTADEEVAALLDRLARGIRAEGEASVRREMESGDRLTAILAGVLAGYLSGRQ